MKDHIDVTMKDSHFRVRLPEVDHRIILLAVVAISAVYVSWYLDRCWYPADDGVIAQSALRVLGGQLPHRDYDDVYTGGLAYLNAGAFRLLGTTYWSMRLVLMAVFLAWVPVVFWLASRFVRPFAAAGTTLLAVVWSVPNYLAPMPSWYNLFLATFGVAALFRYLDNRHRRWLLVAGVAGGLSILVKIVGLYYGGWRPAVLRLRSAPRRQGERGRPGSSKSCLRNVRQRCPPALRGSAHSAGAATAVRG